MHYHNTTFTARNIHLIYLKKKKKKRNIHLIEALTRETMLFLWRMKKEDGNISFWCFNGNEDENYIP